MIQDRILDIEQSVIGKSSSPWAKDHNDISFTYLGMGISLIYSAYCSFINITSDEGTSLKSNYFRSLSILGYFLGSLSNRNFDTEAFF